MSEPNDQPEPPSLRIASFATHATRGLIRHRPMRRRLMISSVMLAVVMLFLGSTFLAPLLDPKLRPGWFMFYWLACGWVTFTAVLLAIFDLLLVRVQARDEKLRLAEEMAARAAVEGAD